MKTVIFRFILILFSISSAYLHKAFQGLHPYMAVISESGGSSDDPDQWYLTEITCQGSVITPLWILTTSRCIQKPKSWEWKTNYDAFIGFSGNDDISSAIRRDIIDWIAFGKEYDISDFTVDDIALCKIEEPLEGLLVMHIPLNTVETKSLKEASDDLLSKSNCSYVGWVNEIKIVSVPVKVLGVLEYFKMVGLIGISMNLYTKQNIHGAVGAALVCNNVQVGLYLYEINGIGIYTKIASYLPWIYTVLRIDAVSKYIRISNIINKDHHWPSTKDDHPQNSSPANPNLH
ncbi:hypothetical protein ILUMI_00693 [Ignelater luminosus]|uniref:Peptidase S1 domain-containing protein n=1 Tax=Ignelater luminosus TaxID=2038154 RepID=A0A8K0DLD5_IGNLU|nr:hypothetical protein ILUMI_00693 [Ignelater luminosus]